MNALLINPITSERGMYTSTPNLGLGYLAAALRNNGFGVSLFDGMKKGMTQNKLKERLHCKDYDVAGIQTYTCSVKEAQNTLDIIRKVDPDITTITGGAHPSCDPENTLDCVKSDFAFRGEAEIGLPALLNQLQGNGKPHFHEIPNLIWKNNGGTVCNPLQPVTDIDAVGLPSWDLIQPEEYPDAPIGGFVQRFPLATISCSRGCIHHCTYCANALIMGRKLRTRSSRSILEEINLLYHKYGVRELQIIDDCFTSSRELAVSVCEGIIKDGLNVSLSFPNGVRVESLDKELVRLLERAGCYSLGLGIESGSQRIVDHMKRGQKLDMIEEKIAMIKSVSRIRLSGFFIIGYPEENERDILDTINLAKRLPLSRAQFTVWMPVPGSEMTERLKREAWLDNLDLSKVALQQINYIPPALTINKLKRLLRKAYCQFYFRPHICWGLLNEVRSASHLRNITRRVFQSFFLN